MAVNTTDISAIFVALTNDAKTLLTTFVNDNSMDQTGFAAVLSDSIKNAQSLAVNYVADAPLKVQQIAESAARVINDGSKTASEIALQTQQIAESSARVINENAQSAKDLLVKDKEIAVKTQQIAESAARILNDNSKTAATVALTNRQTVALDDAKKVKKAELLGNTASLIESGGSTAPAQVWTDFNAAVAAI